MNNFDVDENRITLTEIRRKILQQSPIFEPDDLIPAPCNPDALVMGYALKLGGEVSPLTWHINPDDGLNEGKKRLSMSKTRFFMAE